MMQPAPIRPGYVGNRGRPLSQAAEALGISQRTLERLIQAGQIKSIKLSPRRRIVTDMEIERVLSGVAA
jgi:excisionase family DNA binding protein